MGSSLWLITILKDQPWLGLVFGLVVVLALLFLKKWLVMKMTAEKEET